MLDSKALEIIFDVYGIPYKEEDIIAAGYILGPIAKEKSVAKKDTPNNWEAVKRFRQAKAMEPVQQEHEAEALADILAGLSAQGLPQANPETRAVAQRILEDYGTWEAYRYDLEVVGAQKHLTQSGRYRPLKTDEEQYRASADRRIAYHLSLDSKTNGRLLFELLAASWDGLEAEGQEAIVAFVDEQRNFEWPGWLEKVEQWSKNYDR